MTECCSSPVSPAGGSVETLRVINSIDRKGPFFTAFGVTSGDNIYGHQNAGGLFATTTPAQGDAKITVDGNSKGDSNVMATET